MNLQSFPNTRLRRNRKSAWIRDLIAETTLTPSNLILPIFLIEGQNISEEIKTLPDVKRLSIDLALKEIKTAKELGIPAIMLFPAIEQNKKSLNGEEALNSQNLICRAIKEIKNSIPEIGIICDVALDPYTTHGHDGITNKNGEILNDKTVEILCQQALIQAQAGCDIVAPSDMMDGRVLKIRQTLDQNGFEDVGIMSYSAKYASNFYSPFRNAVKSDQNLAKSDKKSYQMDFRNSKEAMREIALDINEGADSIIIKPALPYLDIIAKASQHFEIPLIAYQVSGEYAMLKIAAREEILDFEKCYLESLYSLKRGGADAVITYGAILAAKLLQSN